MADGLFLGRRTDDGETLTLDPNHLTTHAVCLGMTGSGKTGLGIVTLEELARRRVPLLVVDLKGDMVNLLLNFPQLAPADFQPWLPADAVAGRDPQEVAEQQAALWSEGLSRDGLAGADLRAVKDGVQWQLLTPGVSSMAPLDILPTLSAPPGMDPDADPDGARERIDGLASALLSLVGRGGDPLTDRDHVLLAATVLEHWRRGDTLDMVGLLSSLADPPMETLGAFALDTFYPRTERMKLVMQLNTLVASPGFAAWTEGVPLEMESLLGTADAPRATILTVAHLDTRQRLFVLGLVFSELRSWMRRQTASSGLRALLYLDEVQGILPPHPANPPTKEPLLTLLKQGRAFGVGVWLATQNPVDLDYKALGNAGVKLVGRLITDRDRDRALEGLGMTRLEDGRDVDRLVSGLSKRQFVLHNVRAKQRLRVFSSRWAMSYLRGPLALAEIDELITAARPVETVTADPNVSAAADLPSEPGKATPPVMPSGETQVFDAGGGGLAQLVLAVRCRLTIERKTVDLYRSFEERWLVPIEASGTIDFESAEAAVEPLDTVAEPPPGMRFPSAAPSGLHAALKKGAARFVRWRARRPVMVLANPKLKISAEIGEDRDSFIDRCLELADRSDDRRQERVKVRFEKKVDTVRNRLERERDELERDEAQLDSRKTEEKLGMVEGLFSVLLGSRSLRSATGKAASKMRSAASKRRMRQSAAASVDESEREIDRLEDQVEDLLLEMQEEIDRIAAESEDKAENLDEIPVRPKQADVVVLGTELIWR